MRERRQQLLQIYAKLQMLSGAPQPRARFYKPPVIVEIRVMSPKYRPVGYQAITCAALCGVTGRPVSKRRSARQKDKADAQKRESRRNEAELGMWRLWQAALDVVDF